MLSETDAKGEILFVSEFCEISQYEWRNFVNAQYYSTQGYAGKIIHAHVERD
jgi:hypothetical protein